MKRDNHTQLPSSGELNEIIKVEAQREFPAGKEDIHYPDFTLIVELLEKFGLSTEYFSREISKDELGSGGITEEASEVVAKLAERLIEQSVSEIDIELLNSIYDYLGEEDRQEKTDILFVFGSARTTVRVEKAIEIFNNGLADKIMMAGGNPFYDQQEVSEAEKYKRIAVEAGIPEDKIITEENSITIPDNVRSSLNLLDKLGIEYQSIALVNSPYTQRRGWVHFKKYLPDTVSLVRVNSSTKYTKENWYQSEAGIGGLLGLLEIVFSIALGIMLFNEELTIQITAGATLIIIAAAFPHIREIYLKRS